MLKFIAITVLLIGTAFGVPAIRDRITPPLAPLLGKLGPVGEKLSKPAKIIAARTEAGLILRKVGEEWTLTRTLPSPLGFTAWVKLHVRTGIKAAGLDPWGVPYYFVREAKSIAVGSQGPDMKRNTPDDVRISVPF